ncbi:MAG: S41 family peptidase [Deltaproteobacteria bacterium]|nr:MAG: S41 family peptidase [Deltaproteobacteria bacterium]
MKKHTFIAIFTLSILSTQPLLAKGNSSKEIPYKELELFSKTLSLTDDAYVEEVDNKEMVLGAIRGMLSTLDPHSVFMTPEQYKELKADTEGKFGGIGLEVTFRNDVLTAVTPMEDSPAKKAGLREKDKILKIEGTSTQELGFSESVKKLRGPRGTKVKLTILHEGAKDPVDVTIVRDIIRIKSVKWEVLEDGYGLIRVASFQDRTTSEFQKALSKIEAKSKLKGLIIDLRNNPGGLLDEAVSLSDLFLTSGTIVSTRSRDQIIDKREAADNGEEPKFPIVVLVNGGTASAAEIVSGALQDQKRATILGTQTFGKGSVQNVIDMGDGYALKLTIARYFTPNGRSIQATGITPDVIVNAKGQSGKKYNKDVYMREADLKGHLKGDGEKDEKSDTNSQNEDTKKSEDAKNSKTDFQKNAALDYLKTHSH